jgi:hypothetical protein
MYKIKGIDQIEYGPAPAGQVQAWILEGRINAETLLLADGTTEWRPAASFPEFADLLEKSARAKAVPPPVSTSVDPDAFAREIIARGVQLDIGSCFRRAWDKMQKDFWAIVGVNLLIWLLIVVASGAYVGLLVFGPLMGGIYHYLLRKVRGQSARLEDAFAGFSMAFVQLMLAGLVTGILTGVGLLLCIVPGLYLLVAWSFALLLVFDRKLDFWPAMEVSRKVVNSQFWPICGLVLLCLLLNIAGLIVFVVAAAITLPLTTLAQIYAYEDLFSSGAAPVA